MVIGWGMSDRIDTMFFHQVHTALVTFGMSSTLTSTWVRRSPIAVHVVAQIPAIKWVRGLIVLHAPQAIHARLLSAFAGLAERNLYLVARPRVA